MEIAQMAELLDVGVDLKVKFRLPLLQRGYHEALVTIVDVVPEEDGVRVTANYKQIDAESAQAVKQLNVGPRASSSARSVATTCGCSAATSRSSCGSAARS